MYVTTSVRLYDLYNLFYVNLGGYICLYMIPCFRSTGLEFKTFFLVASRTSNFQNLLVLQEFYWTGKFVTQLNFFLAF